MKKVIVFSLLMFFNIRHFNAQEYWKTTPTGVSEENPKAGTLENKPFTLVTHNSDRIVIDTNGRVKINKLKGSGRRMLYVDSLGQLLAEGDGDDPLFGVSNDNPCREPNNTLEWAPWMCASKPCLPNMIPWQEGGNSIGPSGNNTAGTCSNHDFILKSAGTNRLWLKTNGKIGIDEANPTAKFEVNESTLLPAGSGNYQLLTSVRANVNNNFAHNTWVLRDQVGTNDWQDTRLHDGISVDISFIVPGIDTRTWWERQAQADEQSWGTGAATYLRLKPNQLQVSEQPNAPNTSALCVNVNTGNAFEIYDENTQKINFKVKANGYCYAREINVMPTSITFPDYVFEKNYKLQSLKSLESFIKANKHLPNIPNAAEVEKNGINVAELQIKQMEKIEEAFLYIIQLKKENEELKKRVEKLESTK